MAKFELYKSSNGEFRWRLKSSNGQIIATSGEGYTTKASAQNGHQRVSQALQQGSQFVTRPQTLDPILQLAHHPPSRMRIEVPSFVVVNKG